MLTFTHAPQSKALLLLPGPQATFAESFKLMVKVLLLNGYYSIRGMRTGIGTGDGHEGFLF